MEDDEITAETIREVINNTDPVLEMLSLVLRELAIDTVGSLAGLLEVTGNDPKDMPGEHLLQAILIESDKHLKPTDRETWIHIYDSYHEIKDVIEGNPELRAEYNQKRADKQVEPKSDIDQELNDLLDGKF